MSLQSFVIAGGGISGLLCAAAVSPHVECVTVVERDRYPAGPEPRRGVPQGRQVHALLGAGQHAMAELLPGIVADFEAAGATLVDSPADLAVFGRHGWAGRVRSGDRTVMMRRPHIEHVVRQRVRRLPNVSFVEDTVTGLSATADDARITGIHARATGILGADLVIDATGRLSRSVEWLAELGYAGPAEKEMRSHIGYATAEVRLPEGIFPDGVRGVLTHPHPDNCRGAAVVPADNGVHLIAGLGMMDRNPPREMGGFLSHLDAAPSPIVGEIARKAEFLGPVVPFSVRGSRRRLWEELGRRPDGYLLVGDAVMAFNPLYGQGMSVAACEAVALSQILLADNSAEQLGRRAQHAMKDLIDTVFAMAVATDAVYDGVDLIGVEPPTEDERAASAALSQLATEDAEIALAAKRYAHFFDRQALGSASVATKLARWIERNGIGGNVDPTVIPAIIS